MYARENSEDEITDAVERLMRGESSAFKRRLVLVLSRLKESEWEMLKRRLRRILDAHSELTPEQENEALVNVYRQQLLAEKRRASSVSSRSAGKGAERPEAAKKAARQRAAERRSAWKTTLRIGSSGGRS